jgi:hypothetical protein
MRDIEVLLVLCIVASFLRRRRTKERRIDTPAALFADGDEDA